MTGARGIAVLLMLEWHTADAWTRPYARHSAAFDWVLILGGFAAPLFLWLAGLGVVLSAARRAALGESRRRVSNAICRRGLEIFVLAFLFRLQAFIVSPGSHAVSIFRVDILNIMGLAIVLAGLLWAAGGNSSRTRLLVFGAMAAAIALVTPMIRAAAAVDGLPLWIQWHLRPSGDLTTFTLFPWTGFVLAGAACGAVLASAAGRAGEQRTQAAFAAVGALLFIAGYGFSRQPTIYEESSFWTSSPTWFAMRAGVLMVGVAAIHVVAEMASRSNRSWPMASALERLGRNSLFVYWIHVELVYGYASWPLHHRLPVWGALAACFGFSLLMYRAIGLRDRVAENLALRRQQRPVSQTVTA